MLKIYNESGVIILDNKNNSNYNNNQNKQNDQNKQNNRNRKDSDKIFSDKKDNR